MIDVMLDIETLGTDSNSVIVSISAVVFDLQTGKIGGEYEAGVNILEQLLNGGVIDTSTVAWWAAQSAAAKQALYTLKAQALDIVLSSFNTWLAASTTGQLKDVRIWGNGAVFDNVIVRNLYKRSGVNFVLPYWCDMDVRTLVAVSGINTKSFKFEGTKHCGIDDCKHQIKYCAAAYKEKSNGKNK